MKKQTGFTLIELVIVVIILGLLGAAAIPRFINATDDARDASVEGVAGGFASAVGLVRAEWELSGRPDGATDITYDTIALDVTDTGYPASLSGDEDTIADMDVDACQEIFDNILQSSPSSTSVQSTALTYNNERYIVNIDSGLCEYVLAENINVGDAVPVVNSATTDAQGFTYNADSGQVSVFKN